MVAPFIAHCADGRCRPLAPSPTARTDVEITASVGVNAYNRFDDVRRIQDALNQVGVSNGGPEPPLATDGICGPKTIAAIKRFQKVGCGFKWPDGRIDPGRRTHQELKKRFVAANPYPIRLIYARLPNAVSWIHKARHVLTQARLALGTPFAVATGPATLVNKYFHIDGLPAHARAAAINRIDSLYVTMLTCIGHSYAGSVPGTGYFQEDPVENRHYAYAFPGGYSHRDPVTGGPVTSKGDGYTAGPNVRTDAIYVCPRKLDIESVDYYTVVIVHELAHFCGPHRSNKDYIDDHAYRRDGQKFFELTPAKALTTADCYAHLAGEAALGREAPHK